MTAPTQPHSNNPPGGSGPGPFKYCGGFGIPAFIWPDGSPCPGPTGEVNTHGPLPLPDFTGPIDTTKSAVTGSLNALGDIPNSLSKLLGPLGNASFWKGLGLVIGAGILFIGGFILWFRSEPTTNVVVQNEPKTNVS